ncbi:MAG: hypothetical protein COB60_12965, partial [Flavobacteriaceae bacterium]
MRYYVIFFLLFTAHLSAQKEIDKDSILLSEKYIVFEGDTLQIDLEEVFLLKKLKFDTSYNRRYYYWFRRKTLKAYPFAKMTAERLTAINDRLLHIKSKSKRRRYTRRLQKFMEAEFTAELKKLTRTEGRILIKLIHRQTGETAFELVKELRSGWKAFWYQSTAKLFKLNLKTIYDPYTLKEDYRIEDILQRSFVSGILEEQEAKIP